MAVRQSAQRAAIHSWGTFPFYIWQSFADPEAANNRMLLKRSGVFRSRI
jgi:hypothetical protein